MINGAFASLFKPFQKWTKNGVFASLFKPIRKWLHTKMALLVMETLMVSLQKSVEIYDFSHSFFCKKSILLYFEPRNSGKKIEKIPLMSTKRSSQF